MVLLLCLGLLSFVRATDPTARPRVRGTPAQCGWRRCAAARTAPVFDAMMLPGRADITSTRSPRRMASSSEWVTNEHGAPVGLPQRQQFFLQDLAHLRIEGRERFVHEQDLGLDRQRCARSRRAVSYRPRAVPGTTRARSARAQLLEVLHRPLVALFLGHLGDVEPEASVGQHALPRDRSNSPGTPSRSAASSLRTRRSIVPSLGLISPAAMRRNVDLPHPEGPTRQTNSPSPMSRSRGPSAWMRSFALPSPKYRSTPRAMIFAFPGIWPYRSAPASSSRRPSDERFKVAKSVVRPCRRSRSRAVGAHFIGE